MNKTLKSILSDLYKLDPELKKSEKALIPLLEKLVESKPDLKLDDRFVQNLRAKLMERADELAGDKKPIRPSLFSRILTPILGGTIVMATLAFALMYWNGNLVLISNPSQKSLVTELKDRDAFGPLPAVEDQALRVGEITKVKKVTSSPTSVSQPKPSEESVPAMAELAATGEAAMDDGGEKMIASGPMMYNTLIDNTPPPGKNTAVGGSTGSQGVSWAQTQTIYRYIYKGEPLNLTENTVPVYRSSHKETDDSALVKAIGKFGFGLMNVAAFKNLKIENMMLSQDQKNGYLLSLSFRDNTFSIQPNYAQWPNPAETCNGDTDCLNQYQIKFSDYPGDKKIIEWVNEFSAKYGIDLSNYGEPVIQKFWEENPEAEVDVLPDEIYLVYPLLIDNKPVYDPSGNPFGLSVTVNLRYKTVSGISNLISPSLESSLYEAETDEKVILDYAEKGSNPYLPERSAVKVKTIDVELGTPEKVIMVIWQASKSGLMENENLFVPALRFPIIKTSKEELYFWQKAILVPLAKELLNRQDQSIGVPMPLIERAK